MRLGRHFLLVALVSGGCSNGSGRLANPPGEAFPADSVLAARAAEFPAPAYRIDTVARGLDVPWALAFAPDGRTLVTERTGRVRVIEQGTLRADPWAVLQVFATGSPWLPESGLLGIALPPDYAATGHVYVYGTFPKAPGENQPGLASRLARRLRSLVAPERASRYENRVYRFTDRGGRGVDSQLVVGGLPANYLHAAGAMTFGPDGMLYLTTGDALYPPAAQRSDVPAGKVLRYRPDGGIPADNPQPDSPVLARGLRNSQGLAWEPATRTLFAVDHGPTGMDAEGGRTGHDELNVIEPAANYGWPRVIGRDTTSGFRQPVRVWPSAQAPAGLALYAGTEQRWRGNLFVTGLRSMQLRRLVIEPDGAQPAGWRVAYDEPMLVARFGRLRAVAAAPDGSVYVGTSNRDGRGTPGPEDDLILRLVPLPCGPSAATRRRC